MWEPVPLPYKTDRTDVVLPTTEEIRASTTVLHNRYGSQVVAVNDHVVAKYGGGIEPLDGQALLYLERHVPEVPAPRLYAMYYDSEQLFIVMQRIPGERLDRIWESLTTGEKDSITAQLHSAFTALRQAERPNPSFFGGLDGGPVRHYLFYNPSGEQKHLGPFNNAPSFVKALTDNFRNLRERNKHPLFRVRFWEENLHKIFENTRPVLTHGDIHRRNIVVCLKEARSTNGDRPVEVAIVDWERAGWMPEFWEYYCASTYFQNDGFESEWPWRVGHFIPVYLGETAAMSWFDRDMGP